MDYLNRNLEGYLSTPCEKLTEGEYYTMKQEVRYQRTKKITKILIGTIGSVVAGGLILVRCLAGNFADPLFPVELMGGVVFGVLTGGLTSLMGSFFEPNSTEISGGKKLTKEQLKALKNKIKEYENLRHYNRNFIFSTITYDEYKQQQGITTAEHKEIETSNTKYIGPSNDDDLNSNL